MDQRRLLQKDSRNELRIERSMGVCNCCFPLISIGDVQRCFSSNLPSKQNRDMHNNNESSDSITLFTFKSKSNSY